MSGLHGEPKPRAAEETVCDSGVLGGQGGAAGGVTHHRPPTHSWGGRDRGVLVPLLPITAAGWRMVLGALGLLPLMSPKEIFLPSLGL